MTHASVLHAVIFFCAGALAAAVVRAEDAPRLAALLAAVVLRARNRHYRAVFEMETADADHDGVPDVYREVPGRGA